MARRRVKVTKHSALLSCNPATVKLTALVLRRQTASLRLLAKVAVIRKRQLTDKCRRKWLSVSKHSDKLMRQ